DLLTQMTKSVTRCLVIKDLTTLFSQREDKVRAVLGDFQSIYDGEYTKWTGTLGGLNYTTRFSLVACITPATLTKHHRYLSEIGPRFLFYLVPTLTEEEVNAGLDKLPEGVEAEAKRVAILKE